MNYKLQKEQLDKIFLAVGSMDNLIFFCFLLFCFSLTGIRKILNQLPLFLTPPQDILESLMEHALDI